MTDKTQAVHDALGQMDHTDLEQWNKDGTPKLDVVRIFADDPEISMADFDEAAAAYRRDTNAPTGGQADAEGDDAPVDPAKPNADEAEPEKTEAEKDAEGDEAASEAAKLTKRIEALQGKSSALQAELNALQKERDKHLEKAKARAGDSRRQTDAIQRYFATQDAATQQRAEANAKVLAALAQAGVPAPKVYPSQLDASMARKTGHGRGRKPHPTLGDTGGQDGKAK